MCWTKFGAWTTWVHQFIVRLLQQMAVDYRCRWKGVRSAGLYQVSRLDNNGAFGLRIVMAIP